MNFCRFLIAFLIAVLSSCSTLTVEKPVVIDEDNDWLQLGGNAGNQNVSKSDAKFSFPLNLYWDFDTDAGLSKNCLSVADAVLFVSTLKGECYAIDVSSGRSIGRLQLDGSASYSTPLILGNSVVLTASGNNGARIVKASLQTGLIRWSRLVGNVESSPVLYDKEIFVCSVNGKVYRLSPLTGSISWSVRASLTGKSFPQFYSSPAIADNKVYAGAINGSMYCFDAKTGLELWNFATGEAIFSDASEDSGKIFFGSDDLNFYCIDSTGSMNWKTDLSTRFLAASTFFEDQVITAGIDGKIYSLNKKDGKVKWEFATKGPISATPLLHGDKIFVGSFDRRFYCISARDGSLIWSQPTEGRLRSSAVVWRDYVFVAGDDKYVYCFSNQVMKPTQ